MMIGASSTELHLPRDDEPLGLSRAEIIDLSRKGIEACIGVEGAALASEEIGREAALLYARRMQEWPKNPRLPGPPDPEPLPLDALPSILRDQVESIAGALQVPPDLPFLLTMTTLSAALAGKVEVQPRHSWKEPVGLYAATILPPASRKSPAFEAMTGPIREWEANRIQEMSARVLTARDLLEVAERKLDQVKGDAAKGKAELDEVELARIEVEEARARVPSDGRLLCGDVTPEEMVRRMANQHGRLAILEPEPGPLQLVAGRYRDTAQLDELKKAWSGEMLLQDRVGRPPIRVRRPALTLGLCLQPGVLEGLQNSRAFRIEGVLGRILWCRPPHGLGSRLTGRAVPPLDEAAGHTFSRTLGTLLDAPAAEMETDGTLVPHVLQLNDDALEVLDDFERKLEADLGDGGRFAEIRDWAGKAHGQAVRVAALLEIAARAGDGRMLFRDPIGRWAMKSATEIIWALSTHALAVLGELGMDKQTALLAYVLRRARSLPDGGTMRDLYEATKGKAAIDSMEDLWPLAYELEDRGCLRLVEDAHPGPGRPPSPRIEVHPDLGRDLRTIRKTSSENGGRANSANSANELAGMEPDMDDLFEEGESGG